jgi:putative FmdB family regulatory protein
MPTYEYHCEKCGEAFARVEHMEEHSQGRPTCPHCKSRRVEQVFTVPAVSTSKKS